MSQTIFRKCGRWLCFLTLTTLFVLPPSIVAQDKNRKDGETLKKAAAKNGAQGLLSGKSTVPGRASVSHHVASANYKRRWGCDPFSRAGK